MVLKVSLLLGVLSAATQRTTSLSVVVPFCFENDCYFQLENSGKSWMEAQDMCRRYNSTLPIVDTPNRQRSVEAALRNFTLTSNIADVWLGANASDYGAHNWRWLDGSQYNETISGGYMYSKSYALILKNASTFFLTASEPRKTYSYICQYNTSVGDACTKGTGIFASVVESRCYVKYNFSLSWFNARNACLANGGDLASFNGIFLLNGIFFNTTGSWIGLRSSQWFWRNAVTELSSDVIFSQWSSDQPDDATPSCLSTNSGDFPQWRDRNCSCSTRYICQVLNETSTVTIEDPPTVIGGVSTTINPPLNAHANESNGSKVNVPLAIGLGVGLGGAAIIAILIIIIVVVVRRKRRDSRSIGNSKSRETLEDHNDRMKPEEEEEEEATEMNEAGSQSRFDDAKTDYATVQEARGSDLKSQSPPSSTNQGLVYADVGFGRDDS